MSFGDYEDAHLAGKPWTKKKEQGVIDNSSGTSISKPGGTGPFSLKKTGKIILNDELSMNRQVRKAVPGSKAVPMSAVDRSIAQLERDNALMSDKLSSSQYSNNDSADNRSLQKPKHFTSGKLQEDLEQNLSAQSAPFSAGGSSKQTSVGGKHNISSAKTGIRMTNGHEGSAITGGSSGSKEGTSKARNFSGHLTANQSHTFVRPSEPTMTDSSGGDHRLQSSTTSPLDGLSLLRQ